MPTTPKLSPTVYVPSTSHGPRRALDADVPFAAPAPLADAAPGAEHDTDRITGISLTFHCLPLGGAAAARGFEPFALP